MVTSCELCLQRVEAVMWGTGGLRKRAEEQERVGRCGKGRDKKERPSVVVFVVSWASGMVRGEMDHVSRRPFEVWGQSEC
jgi:hypothetical protein